MTAIRTRITVSGKEKKALRAFYYNQEKKPTQIEVADWFKSEFGKPIAQSTLSRILSDRFAYLDDTDQNLHAKRNRSPKYPALEKALYNWIQDAHFTRTKATNDILKAAATKLWGTIPEYREASMPEFSNGWVEGFRRRYLERADEPSRGEYFIDVEHLGDSMVRIQDVASFFPKENIFNVDETGLFWKLLPNQTPSIENCGHTKRYKAKISIVMCANSTGSEKLPLWVIGYAKRPRAFHSTGTYPENIGIHWCSSGKASMTLTIMKKWLRWFDANMEGRKVLLVLDNSDVHRLAVESIRCSSHAFQNTTIIFLPSNSTNVYQPFELGVFNAFKILYRLQWTRYWKTLLSNGQSPQTKTNLLLAIKWVASSWNISLSESIIDRAFRRSGVLNIIDDSEAALQVPFMSNEVKEIIDLIQEVLGKAEVKLESYLSPFEESLEDNAKNLQDNEIAADFTNDKEFETDEEEQSYPPMPHEKALQAIQLLLQYEAQRPNNDNTNYPQIERHLSIIQNRLQEKK
ncbi:ARS-binding protein [Schizosaccharomyces octosporus yFS286]|uniref:ARS-binding protein n=1 Tax=Schizosaccharomyces octosporus (strain yFS286) TaxID=483514 RepID=S9RHG1_SCHOY|nr:ARS-binding protein [Schizosaccharomyces octosporus yFS286]EPX73479.1 ARS-binding protein [Schizosaccharomyces octosporus yFS286]